MELLMTEQMQFSVAWLILRKRMLYIQYDQKKKYIQ